MEALCYEKLRTEDGFELSDVGQSTVDWRLAELRRKQGQGARSASTATEEQARQQPPDNSMMMQLREQATPNPRQLQSTVSRGLACSFTGGRGSAGWVCAWGGGATTRRRRTSRERWRRPIVGSVEWRKGGLGLGSVSVRVAVLKRPGRLLLAPFRCD